MDGRARRYIIGRGLQSGRCPGGSFFIPDARHFLKQIANRLGLKTGAYTIVGRPRTDDAPAEAVLRSEELLVLVFDEPKGVRVEVARCRPGVPVPPDERIAFRIEDVDAIGGPSVIEACRAVLNKLQAAPTQT